MLTPDWIAVDWGTSNVRAWAMDAQDRVLARAASDKGMGRLTPPEFEGALRDLLTGWETAGRAIVACGMVGARQGWVEAPYSRVPCAPAHAGLIAAPVTGHDLAVHIVPGLAQDSPADVMRGEETQIAGFLALHPRFDGVLCLPGTHTKWAHLSAGEVVSFRTFMTGELFATISTHTVLRHSLGGEGWDDDAFDEALADALSHPERLSARLFSLRAESLLHGLTPAAARARLSGLLAGMELAAARPYWLGQQVGIVGEGRVAGLYARALAAQGLTPLRTDAEAVTLAGLAAAHRALKGQG